MSKVLMSYNLAVEEALETLGDLRVEVGFFPSQCSLAWKMRLKA